MGRFVGNPEAMECCLHVKVGHCECRHTPGDELTASANGSANKANYIFARPPIHCKLKLLNKQTHANKNFHISTPPQTTTKQKPEHPAITTCTSSPPRSRANGRFREVEAASSTKSGGYIEGFRHCTGRIYKSLSHHNIKKTGNAPHTHLGF